MTPLRLDKSTPCFGAKAFVRLARRCWGLVLGLLPKQSNSI